MKMISRSKKRFNKRVAFDLELFVRKTTGWYTDNAHIQNVFVYASTCITYRIMSTKCRQTIWWKIENGTLFFIHAQVAMFINHVRHTITQFHLSFISQKITNRMNTCPISHALNSNQAMHIYMLTIHYCERSQRWKYMWIIAFGLRFFPSIFVLYWWCEIFDYLALTHTHTHTRAHHFHQSNDIVACEWYWMTHPLCVCVCKCLFCSPSY